MRVALTRLLGCAGYAVRAYASAGEFLVSEPDPRNGCILLDLELGGPSGLDLQQAVLRHPPALPIVFMSAYGDVPRSVGAMKAGATDFLCKPFSRHVLLAAVRAAINRCSDRATENVRLHAGFPSLCKREQAVLDLLVAGKRNKQIAADLNLSERTVKTSRASVMRKFQADSLATLLVRVSKLMPLSSCDAEVGHSFAQTARPVVEPIGVRGVEK